MAIIGITSGFGSDGEHFLRRAYTASTLRAGGSPIILPPELSTEVALGLCDAVILSGGGDIEPERFASEGEIASKRHTLGGISPERDEFELTLARLAFERGMPILAICRGMQILNVALGGTLELDIPNHRQSLARHETSHTVALEAGSRVREIYGSPEVAVNSFHHQSLGRVASELRVEGSAPDGTVEAVSAPTRGFCVGVQWHPEALAEHGALFAAFVEAAKG